MAGRGPQSFKKRQREQHQKEKREEKLARRMNRSRAQSTEERHPEEQSLLAAVELHLDTNAESW